MEGLNLKDKYGKWKSYKDSIFLCGTVFKKNEVLEVEELQQQLHLSLINNHLSDFLQRLNGFFTIILKLTPDKWIIISDVVRSIPLFYTIKEGSFVVSDNIDSIIEEDHRILDEVSQVEYAKTGYVTGHFTLLKQVYQTQAAEIVHVETNILKRNFYYHFLPKNSSGINLDKEAFFLKLDKTLVNAINRLKTLSKDRQIILPLSGGYDSRVLALYLKKMDFQNVVAFTFGSKNSAEVKVSQKVAEALSFDWHFVEYTNKKWKKWRHEPFFKEYLRFKCSYSSVPTIMVFPAVWELKKQAVIKDDAIVIPGHTGDFIVGRHIPKSLDEGSNESNILAAILNKHFSYSPGTLVSPAVESKLRGQINQIILSFREEKNPVSIFESWEWKERQSKFIVNSNRYYDYIGLNWWMPLWDREVVSFWEEAPLAFRKDKSLWPAFIKEGFRGFTTGTDYNKDFCIRMPNKFLRKLQKFFIYFNSDLRLFGFIPFLTWLKSEKKFSGRLIFQYLINNTFNFIYDKNEFKKHR